MNRNSGIDWLELAAFGVVAAGACVLVLVLPNFVRYATVIALAAFLVVNAFNGLRRKRFSVAFAFVAGAVFTFAFGGPFGLALAYIAVLSIILGRSIRAGAENAAPAYILFGHES